MSVALLIAGSVVVTVAAAFHVYVFLLESVVWTRPSTRRLFGVASAAEAETLRPMAFNQGFYNLFLAVGAAIGVALLWGFPTAGLALVLLAAGSMALAGLVLLVSSPRSRRAALLQGGPPLIGVVLLLLSLAS
ncbi:DUF1304 domain-containing protein [soil metagenome]